MLSLVVILLCSFTSTNQKQQVSIQSVTEQIPIVFVINQKPTVFESLHKEYSTLLLSACQEDMNKAFETWKELLQEISLFALEKDVDITGVKMWLKVFWSKDGQIKHIAYNLRPESKNIDRNELTQMLKQFVMSYQNSLANTSSNFSHYGSVSYPIHSAIASRPK